MLGEDIVLFRGTKGDVVALTDWCPHRGARLSLGECDFAGTVTCPYHGYVFDETGQCVAGLIESVNSPLAPKLRAKNYPTAERQRDRLHLDGHDYAGPLGGRPSLGIP